MRPLCRGCDNLQALDDARLVDAGFQRCRLLPPWTYLSPGLARCAFTPSQHTKCAGAAVLVDPPQLRQDFKEHLSKPEFVLTRQAPRKQSKLI